MISEMEQEFDNTELETRFTGQSFSLYSDYRIGFTSIEFRDWFLRIYVKRYGQYWVENAKIQMVIVNGVAVTLFTVKKVTEKESATYTIQSYTDAPEFDFYSNMDYEAEEVLANQPKEKHMITSKYHRVQKMLEDLQKVNAGDEKRQANHEKLKRLGIIKRRLRRMRMRLLI